MQDQSRNNPVAESLADKKQRIMAVYEGICRAFERADLEGAASFFSNSPEMVKISNGKLLRGKAEMLTYWKERVATMKGISISIANVEMHFINERTIWATASETLSSPTEKIEAIVSNLFILEESVWKILLDHTTYLGH